MAPIPTLYYCGYENCNAKFSRSYKLQCHQRIHTGERPYVCDFEGCDKSYTRPSHLKRHEESHEGSHSCSVEGCSQVLKTKASLQKHLDFFHHQKKHKTYKCNLCKQEFNKHSWLQRHMIRHTGKTPHVCVVEGCGREFLLPSRLKRHMKYHKGYPCEKANCGQVFPHWSFLVKHIKECHPVVHSCDVCGKTFSSSSNMKRHGVVHAEERQVFACEAPNCVRFYTEKKNLVHHVKYFHNRRPYNCTKEHCHRAFKTQAELDEHVLYHNSKKPKRKKKKKSKPTFAAKLAGCVPPVTVAQKPVLKTAEPDLDEGEANKQAKHLPDYVTVTVSVHEMEDVSDSKSCLAIFEDILNSSFVPEEEET